MKRGGYNCHRIQSLKKESGRRGGYWASESEGASEGGQVRIDSNVVCAFVMTEKKSQEREREAELREYIIGPFK